MTRRVEIAGMRFGKSESMRLLVENLLDEGKTIFDAATGDLRGARTARDVTQNLGFQQCQRPMCDQAQIAKSPTLSETDQKPQ